ncbi:xenobiotic compound monooxygenase, DszA family [Stipitochalara longipes BDJ]|nr:xenobiotic compound monooxygenase, DszA family [Stipitochalara longipes BDJ]
MPATEESREDSENGPQRNHESAKANGTNKANDTNRTNGIQGENGTNGVKPKKRLILNAFAMNCPAHLAPGLWKHPRNKMADVTKLSFGIDLAQMLDKANFHALFLADILGGIDVYKGPEDGGPGAASGAQFPVNDPLYLVPAMAAVTKNLAFGITASTTYEQPYAHARRFSTVDHYSNGRVAWNIVTSFLESAARNLGLNTQIEHDERYSIADEFMDVVYKLWEGSWQDGAVTKDIPNSQYADASRIRQINHKRKYFSHAEALFIGGQIPEKARLAVDEFKKVAKEKYGRDPSGIKIIGSVVIIVAATDAEAEEKRLDFLSYGDREGALTLFGGWTGIDLSTYDDDEDFRFVKLPAIQSIVKYWSEIVPGSGGQKWTRSTIVAVLTEYIIGGGTAARVVGSPKTVVDELERWVEIADLDGFNLAQLVNPGSFEDIIEFVLPELQRRGLFRTKVEKEGATARETYLGVEDGWLLPDHPGRKFRWAAGEEPPVYPEAESE